MPVTVTKSGGGLADKLRALKRLEKSDVLVGIPAEATLRKGEEINNASLLFIHTHGSELNNIPARPVLEPSIEKNKKLISPHLGAAAKQMLAGHPQQAEAALERAGIVAANGAKRYFTDPDNGWAPNAPSTIAAKGSDKPLIDTGLLRRSITYVLTEEGRTTVEGPVVHEKPSIAEGVKDFIEDLFESPVEAAETL